MLKYKENPQKLMLALDQFLSLYYGDRQVEFKPNLKEIAARKIPVSLKDYYSFIEKYPLKKVKIKILDFIIFIVLKMQF